VLIKNGSIAGVTAIVCIIIVLMLTGVFVKEPAASATIPADAVSITGGFDGYYQAAGNGFVVKSSEHGTEINVTLEVEALKDKKPEIEKQIADFITAKGWKQNECTVKLYDHDNSIGIDGFEVSSFRGDFKVDNESMVSSLLNMQPREIKKINIPLSFSPGIFFGPSAGKKKKTAAKLMNKQTIRLTFNLEYSVKNHATGDSGRVTIE
jgi:hypothetical protein